MLLVGGAVVAWQSLPDFVESRVRRAAAKVGASLGVQVRLGGVELRGLTEVVLTEVTVREAGADGQPGALLAEFPKIQVFADRPSMRPRLTVIAVTGGRVRVERDGDGKGPLWRLADRLQEVGGGKGPLDATDDGIWTFIERNVPELRWTGGVVEQVGLAPARALEEVPDLAQARLEDVEVEVRNTSRLLDRVELTATLAGRLSVFGGRLVARFEEIRGQPAITAAIEGPLACTIRGHRVTAARASWHRAPQLSVELSQLAIDDTLTARTATLTAEGAALDSVTATGVTVDLARLSSGAAAHGAPGGPAPMGPPRTLERPQLDLVRGAAVRTVLGTTFSKLTTRAELARFRVAEALGRMPIRHLRVEGLRLVGLEDLSQIVDARIAPLLGRDGQLARWDLVEVTRFPGHVQLSLGTPPGPEGGPVAPGVHLAAAWHRSSGDVTVRLAAHDLVIAQVPGGPADPAFGALEIHDTDVSLTLEPTGLQTATGRARLRGVRLTADALARVPVVLRELRAQGTLLLDSPTARLELRDATIGLGDVLARVELDAFDLREAPVLSVRVELPETPAAALVDAVPEALLGPLAGLQASGHVGWSLVGSVDLRDPTTLDYAARATPRDLQITSLGAVDPQKLSRRFEISTREADGTVSQLEVGPGTGRWVPLSLVSPWMAKVLTTTEDGSFYNHRGISYFAIHDAIVQNLEAGRFQRGASTLTQQLVKNVFLTQEKTVARKLQEVFLAWQLEKRLSKDRLLELYLNVVELGPGIYGLKRAASHYFDKAPKDLDAVECAFIASLLPSPRKYYREFRRGAVSEGWRARLQKTLSVMVERGKMTAAEYDALAPYAPVFRSR